MKEKYDAVVLGEILISPQMGIVNCWLRKATDVCCGISMIGVIIYLEKVFRMVDDMVFTTQWGAPVRYGDVNRTIKSVVLKANLQEEELAGFEKREPFVLKPFSPHCFRHTMIIISRSLIWSR